MAGILARLFGGGKSPLQLEPFVRRYKPQGDVKAAPADLIQAYRDRLPEALLELWQRHGLGFYGSEQFQLIDPNIWQPILDRWIVSPPDSVARIPIGLTPFGAIIYYRKLTPTDEDVSALDPSTRQMQVLTWNLVEFFNLYLLDKDSAAELFKANFLKVGQRDAGPLQAGQVYEADPVLLPMQMLKITRVDALEMHKRLRHEVAVQTGEIEVAQPKTVDEALPDAFRSRFIETGARGSDGLGGLYFTSVVDQHRLLSLNGAGAYRLLLWSTDPLPRRRYAPRHYEGTYSVRSYKGDRILSLAVQEQADAPSSDHWDDELLYFEAAGRRFLVRGSSIEDLATNFGWNGELREREGYFLDVRLADDLPEYEVEPVSLTWDDLPASIRELVHKPPLRATVIQVGATQDEGGERSVLLDKGKDDGLRINMRLGSPPEAGKQLFGWASDPEAKTCWFRISSDCTDKLEIGDVLVSRSRTAGPL